MILQARFMQRDEALRLLPEAYRCVLDLVDDGKDEVDIAARLGTDSAAVAALISVAHRKLDRLIGSDTSIKT